MGANAKYRLEMVSASQVKRLPGIKGNASAKEVKKAREFAEKRGCHMPVILSDEGGSMTLLSGEATYRACLEGKAAKIPAVIVQTGGGADDLMFALQSAQLGGAPDAISASAAIVQLIDRYGVPRKSIAESLGKSAAWVNRMEGLSRNLSEAVQRMVAEGQLPSRSAQEVARLPAEVQASFAASAANDFLSKDNIQALVNRYLDEGTGPEERERIVRAPWQALPGESKRRAGRARDMSDSARLSRAMAGCLDSAAALSGLLRRVDLGGAAIRHSDVEALADSLAALALRLRAIVPPGKKNRGLTNE